MSQRISRSLGRRLNRRTFVQSSAAVATAATLGLPGRTGSVVDLRGEVVGPFDGSVALRPHEVVTVRLDG